MSALVGYPVAIAIGLPLHLLYVRICWRHLIVYLVTGALIGMLITWAIFVDAAVESLDLSIGLWEGFAPPIPITILAGFFGALSAGVFWLIARPDRSFRTPARRRK